jgi:hypothetical protein
VKYQTELECDLTGCKYNSACCTNPSDETTYCTLKRTGLILDPDTGVIDCKNYKYDYKKPYECPNCQIKKYGEVRMSAKKIESVEVEDISDLLK